MSNMKNIIGGVSRSWTSLNGFSVHRIYHICQNSKIERIMYRYYTTKVLGWNRTIYPKIKSFMLYPNELRSNRIRDYSIISTYNQHKRKLLTPCQTLIILTERILNLTNIYYANNYEVSHVLTTQIDPTEATWCLNRNYIWRYCIYIFISFILSITADGLNSSVATASNIA